MCCFETIKNDHCVATCCNDIRICTSKSKTRSVLTCHVTLTHKYHASFPNSIGDPFTSFESTAELYEIYCWLCLEVVYSIVSIPIHYIYIIIYNYIYIIYYILYILYICVYPLNCHCIANSWLFFPIHSKLFGIPGSSHRWSVSAPPRSSAQGRRSPFHTSWSPGGWSVLLLSNAIYNYNLSVSFFKQHPSRADWFTALPDLVTCFWVPWKCWNHPVQFPTLHPAASIRLVKLWRHSHHFTGWCRYVVSKTMRRVHVF